MKDPFKAPKSKAKFNRPDGAGNYDNMDDYNIVEAIDIIEGTIQSTPTADTHIANKKYVDDEIDADILTHINTSQAHSDYLLNTGDTASGTYNFDSNTLVINHSTYRVGIGTASPIGKLDVDYGGVYAPSLTYNGAVVLSIGSSSVSLVGAVDDASPWAFWLQARKNVSPNTAYPLSLNPLGGNVGIGTASPLSKLDILQSGNTKTHGLTLEKAGAYRGTMFLNATSNTLNINRGEVAGIGLSIKYGGNVGIGTTSPTELLDINSDAIRIRTAQTPASAGAAGTAGMICWDANYIYVCTATNTWKRTAIATW